MSKFQHLIEKNLFINFFVLKFTGLFFVQRISVLETAQELVAIIWGFRFLTSKSSVSR